MKNDLDELINLVKSCLNIKILKPEYVEENKINPLHGHCYVASEALYHLIKKINAQKEYHPYNAKDTEGVSHWWLQSDDGEILDVTKEQYTTKGKIPPYQSGKPRRFMTTNPSMRAMGLMRSVKIKSEKGSL